MVRPVCPHRHAAADGSVHIVEEIGRPGGVQVGCLGRVDGAEAEESTLGDVHGLVLQIRDGQRARRERDKPAALQPFHWQTGASWLTAFSWSCLTRTLSKYFESSFIAFRV